MKLEEAEVGRWIEHNESKARRFIAGVKLNGDIIIELKSGGTSTLAIEWFKDWVLLPPECKSFDWQPETFPQWIIMADDRRFHDGGYIKRISKHRFVSVSGKGQETELDWTATEQHRLNEGVWIVATEAEAIALLDKPEPVESIPEGVYFSPSDLNFYKEETNRGMGNDFYVRWKSRAKEFPQKASGPVESPDDWVTQDRVPQRRCDQRNWVMSLGGETGWSETFIGERHGHVNDLGSRLELRCRRKDLPPLPEPEPVKPATRKVVLTEWLIETQNGDAYVTCLKNAPYVASDEKAHAIGTREIEVPL